MNGLIRAAGILAATLVVGVTGAVAADLEYDRAPSGYKRHSAYEDHRYRDIYGPAPVHKPAPRYYTAEPVPVVPPAYVYRERVRERDYEPVREPRAYIPAEPRGYSRYDDAPRYRSACVSRDDVKRRLVSEGWRDFYDLDLRDGVARIEARHRGELFVLNVDHCTGSVVSVSKAGRSERGPYAYEDDRPRRPYY